MYLGTNYSCACANCAISQSLSHNYYDRIHNKKVYWLINDVTGPFQNHLSNYNLITLQEGGSEEGGWGGEGVPICLQTIIHSQFLCGHNVNIVKRHSHVHQHH